MVRVADSWFCAGGDDGDRHGRSIQQGGICIWYGGNRSGNYDVMAAVMIGGMTPPCAIALATMLFKKKFTKEEREAGPTNFIMGLAFITEGAIPFAASDPVHVIPCTLVGAGIAGGLSAFFGCTLMAPHGGIFVFATVGKPFLYILAWIIGSIVTAVMLGFIKKDASER